METSELSTDAPQGPSAPGRRRRRPRRAALLALPALLLGACTPADIITVPIDIIVDLFDLGDNEVATPQFEISNGVTVQVVVRAPQDQAGVPVTVHVRCAGGTHASGTVTLERSGDISIGQLSFDEGWPLGADCVVSQEIVQGVEVAEQTITWLNDAWLRADFLNL